MHVFIPIAVFGLRIIILLTHFIATPKKAKPMSLVKKVRLLKMNNYDESDSDEHKRWERQKRANRKKKKRYQVSLTYTFINRG